MSRPFCNTRPKGSGQIRRPPKGRSGYLAHAPASKGRRGVKLGHFDTYRDAERAIEAHIAARKVA